MSVKTQGLCLEKWTIGGYSLPSLQVESRFIVEYNEEKVKITSLCD